MDAAERQKERARKRKREVGANATTGDGCRDAWRTWRHKMLPRAGR